MSTKKELEEKIAELEKQLELKQPKPRQFHIKPKPKLAIVGCSDTNTQTPFQQKDEFEFWGVNNLFVNFMI